MDDIDVSDLVDDDMAGPAALADSIAASVSPTFQRRDDPSLPPYPHGLVLDLLLRTAPVADLLVAYKLSVEDFKSLTQHPVFRQDMRDTRERMKEEGFSFRVRAQAQAEQYLAQAWRMVHDPETPASVRSDLIKWTAKVANLEPQQRTSPQDLSQALPQLAEQMKNLPQGELEMRVFSIIMKKGQNTPPPSTAVTYDAS